MVYGYSKTINEYGLCEMSEVSFAVTAETLRELAEHFLTMADELEGATSSHWHRHLKGTLKDAIGCDVIVLVPN